MTHPFDIWAYIQQEETGYTQPVQVIESWPWSMKEHIKLSILYKNSTYSTGKDDNKPFKNITRPILNLQYRSEGFDVKDIELFVEEANAYCKSFLAKKYHDKWARENNLDTFIDEMVESYVDYGGALVKKVNKAVPEVVPLQSIAFVDQTDILSGPIGIKHFYSPDQLKEMESVGWGKKENGATISVDDLITLSLNQKVKDKETGVSTNTPGKYIEIYEVHGNLPKRYLVDGDLSNEYVSQIQIVGYYHTEKGKQGVVLFAKEEKESPFKLILRDKIHGRALGLGGAEELFEPQVWANYDVIRMKDMLDSASKVIFQTTDSSFTNRNKIKNADNNEVFTLDEGKNISQIDTTPRNIVLFEKSVADWEAHARQMGGANEVSMGEQPKSGTPFALQQLITSEAYSLHLYRRGKFATFMDEIYRDWILPHISREISKDQKFLAELDLKEMQYIAEKIVDNAAKKEINRKILAGEMIDDAEIEALKEKTKKGFMKDNKKMIKLLQGEMKGLQFSVKINIAGKQDYLVQRVEKLNNVFRTVFSNPAILQQPSFAKLFNQILELSGLNPVDFSEFTSSQVPNASQQINAVQSAQLTTAQPV